jgi:general secretion pathway protein K
MSCPVDNRHSVARQRGAALVVALLVFALASALVVAMQKEFTLFLKRGSNAMVAEQADAYLRGGEELAARILREDWKTDREEESVRDDFSELWAENVAPYALDEGGWLLGGLKDLQGRFNLNSLGGKVATGNGKKPRFTARQQQFIRLLQALPDVEVSQQEATAITEAVIDWLDEDGEVLDSGAEDGSYYDRTPSYRAANGSMHSVSELRSIANVTPEIFLALAPLVTVWGEDYSINIHTAPVAVLRSINANDVLAPLSESEGETLEQERGEDGFADLQELLDSPVLKDLKLEAVRENLGETSNFFLFQGEVEVADRVTQMYSVLQRDDQGNIRALVRASGSI